MQKRQLAMVRLKVRDEVTDLTREAAVEQPGKILGLRDGGQVGLVEDLNLLGEVRRGQPPLARPPLGQPHHFAVAIALGRQNAMDLRERSEGRHRCLLLVRLFLDRVFFWSMQVRGAGARERGGEEEATHTTDVLLTCM
jgi:hypothetical protein